MARFRSLSLAIAGCAALGTAHAEEAMTVRLAGSCMPPGTSAGEVLRILEAELSPVQVEPLTSIEEIGDADAILGIDGCTDAPPGARVSVWRRGERRERSVMLSDAAPGTLDRTLSLALAEALRDPAATQPARETWRPGAASPAAHPAATGARRAGRVAAAIAPRAGVLFRFMPASSTPALGVDAGIEWDRVGAGLTVLAAHRTDSLGAATVIAIAGSASLDVVDLGAVATARIAGELGAAIGSGSPNAAAVGHTRAAVHAAVLGGVASVLPVGTGYAAEGFVGGGYASSLNAAADGRRLGSLGGGLVAVEIGIRFR